MKRAVVFPGQGSQVVGMGKDIVEAFPYAKQTFDEVDEAIGQRLSRIIFDGPAEVLTLTQNAQPAIMATSIALLRVLEKETGFNLAQFASYVAGHSLGEYTALCATGVFTLTDTARLIRQRGLAMQQAVPAGQGAMAAVLGLDLAPVQEIAKEASDVGVCAVANDNSPGQVVISGAVAAVNKAIEIAKEKGAKRSVLLPVSAPFHCPLMQPAAKVMQEALAHVSMQTPVVPLVANVTAQAVHEPAQIRELLVQQVTGMVRWRESVQYLASQGVTLTLEIGAGKVLSGLNKRIVSSLETPCVAVVKDIETFGKAA